MTAPVKAPTRAQLEEVWEHFGKGTHRVDVHRASGWQVRHCGHMTANYPWYLVSPLGETVVSHNGRAWRTVAAARSAVLELIAGTRVAGIYRPIARAVVRCYACSGPTIGLAFTAEGEPRPGCRRHAWAPRFFPKQFTELPERLRPHLHDQDEFEGWRELMDGEGQS